LLEGASLIRRAFFLASCGAIGAPEIAAPSDVLSLPSEPLLLTVSVLRRSL
jgi:hypothetical protein